MYNPGRPPFLGVFTQVEIDAINAEIAGGTMKYAFGSTLLNGDTGTLVTLLGTPGAMSFDTALSLQKGDARYARYIAGLWAQRPASASVPEGVHFRATDLGNTIFVNMGTYWKPLGGSMVLAQSAVAASVTATTAETTLASVQIPAGLLGLNGALRARSKWTRTIGANSTIAHRLNSAAAVSAVAAGFPYVQFESLTNNRNSLSSQISSFSSTGFATSSGTAWSTSTVDTGAASVFVFTAQLTSGADTATLEAYTVELLVP